MTGRGRGKYGYKEQNRREAEIYLREQMNKYFPQNNIEYIETKDIEEYMSELDILYMTRVQKERFFNEADYIRLKDSYILTPEKMKLAKDDTCILHPLPRVNEISVKLDDDKRACYFKQVLNAKYMRMALILKLLEDAENGVLPTHDESNALVNKIRCLNLSCITSVEQELDHKFVPTDREGVYKCIYCESEHKI